MNFNISVTNLKITITRLINDSRHNYQPKLLKDAISLPKYQSNIDHRWTGHSELDLLIYLLIYILTNILFCLFLNVSQKKIYTLIMCDNILVKIYLQTNKFKKNQ